jgi:hypothetical protein
MLCSELVPPRSFSPVRKHDHDIWVCATATCDEPPARASAPPRDGRGHPLSPYARNRSGG